MALSSLDTGGAASRSPVMPGSVTTASSYTSADACDHLAPRSFALSPTMGWRGTVRKGMQMQTRRTLDAAHDQSSQMAPPPTPLALRVGDGRVSAPSGRR
ncbi:hypothetical protein B2J93_7863 [Marssonina coronariae]|uniref:Uncharacterized protein n=1 Tax=Diplocarpon coronariae TaxID=2795749 RepID=A0A218ZBR7_9HELO|nr:hypothetical protein B2J93_7863 [Marssonina coronariae]